MKKIIALMACLWALAAGATNITNYPVRTTFNANYWFLLSDVPMQTNWNLPGNYVASTADLNSTSNTLWQLTTNLVSTNIYYTNLYVTNLFVLTNVANIAYITNLYSSNAYFYNLTVTNPITNLSLTANTVVKADANKALASIANGSGVLTNNGTGTFGWIPVNLLSVTNPPDSYFTNLYTTNIYAVSVVASNAFFTNLWASNVYIANLWATNAYINTLYATNIFTQQIKYYTNQSTMAPDFSKGYAAISTNASFAFLDPIGMESNRKFVETTVMRVVNSSGSPILATLPANVNEVPGSVLWITNVTYFTWVLYGSDETNCYGVPTK